jgi:hypothetical protein
MPLVTCPDSEKQISDAAPACIYCGRPFPQVGRVEPPVARSSRVPGRALLRCPQCGSDDVRRLSVVYASGFSSLESSSALVGVGMGDGVRLESRREGLPPPAFSRRPWRRRRLLRHLTQSHGKGRAA